MNRHQADYRIPPHGKDPFELTKTQFGCYTGFLYQDSGSCLSQYSRDLSNSFDSSPYFGVSPSTMSNIEKASEDLFEDNENLELLKTSFAPLLSFSPPSQSCEEVSSDEGFCSKSDGTPSSPETYFDLDKYEPTQNPYPSYARYNIIDHDYPTPETHWDSVLDELPAEPEPQSLPVPPQSIPFTSPNSPEEHIISGERDSQSLQGASCTTSKTSYHLRDRPRRNRRLKRESSEEAMRSVPNMVDDFIEQGEDSFPDISRMLKTMHTGVDPCSKVKTTNRNRDRGPKSWEFLARLLIDSSTNPSIICWEEPETYTFRVVNQDAVAQKWGERLNRPVTYENFARGLRYHYGRGGLRAVPTKKLVYGFGEKGIRFIRDCYSGLELDG